MQWTGERMLTNYNMGKGAIEHLHRYSIITDFIKDKVVLDLASGEGYGTNLIATHAKYVTGVDISAEAVAHAKEKYRKPNLQFLEGSATNVPLENDAVDVIVSFETLEHHDQHEAMMVEFKRVLKPDGLLFISTPEKENYKKIDPVNPFHIKELTLSEFSDLLNQHFSWFQLLHQRFFDVSFMYPSDETIGRYEEYSGTFESIRKETFAANYYFNVAVCSDREPDFRLGPSFFNGSDYLRLSQEQLVQYYESRIKEVSDQFLHSTSYRIGNLFVRPFSFLKRIFSK